MITWKHTTIYEKLHCRLVKLYRIKNFCTLTGQELEWISKGGRLRTLGKRRRVESKKLPGNAGRERQARGQKKP